MGLLPTPFLVILLFIFKSGHLSCRRSPSVSPSLSPYLLTDDRERLASRPVRLLRAASRLAVNRTRESAVAAALGLHPHRPFCWDEKAWGQLCQSGHFERVGKPKFVSVTEKKQVVKTVVIPVVETNKHISMDPEISITFAGRNNVPKAQGSIVIRDSNFGGRAMQASASLSSSLDEGANVCLRLSLTGNKFLLARRRGWSADCFWNFVNTNNNIGRMTRSMDDLVDPGASSSTTDAHECPYSTTSTASLLNSGASLSWRSLGFQFAAKLRRGVADLRPHLVIPEGSFSYKRRKPTTTTNVDFLFRKAFPFFGNNRLTVDYSPRIEFLSSSFCLLHTLRMKSTQMFHPFFLPRTRSVSPRHLHFVTHQQLSSSFEIRRLCLQSLLRGGAKTKFKLGAQGSLEVRMPITSPTAAQPRCCGPISLFAHLDAFVAQLASLPYNTATGISAGAGFLMAGHAISLSFPLSFSSTDVAQDNGNGEPPLVFVGPKIHVRKIDT